jgi:Domain of unknown function (DUF5979)
MRRKGRAIFAATMMTAGSLFFAGTVANGAVVPVDGNATTCADVGFPGSTILGSNGGGQGDGTITGNAVVEFTISAFDGGQKINLTDGPAAGFTIDVVVVKGGNGYNKYTGTDVLGDMVAPDVGQNGNTPVISHWFVCYSGTPPDRDPELGSLSVSKTVVNTGNVTGVPATFVVDIACTDGTNAELTLDGNGAAQVVDDIAAGAVCTATEDTAGLSPVPTVTYSAIGVQIIAEDTVSIVVTNTYTPPVVPPVVPPAVQPVAAAGPAVAAAAVTATPAFTG